MKNVADLYPLTPTQEGILYHSLREPHPELYFEQVRCDLIGVFDLQKFQTAWNSVFERHGALRTAFVWSGSKEPVQVVRQAVTLPWNIVEGPVDTGPLDELARENRRQGFDLQRAPVSRFTIVRQRPEQQHFIWDFHHILLDGWSATMVFDEALAIYNGRPPTTQPQPFRSYLAWSKAQDKPAAEQYWSHLLAEHPGAPELGVASPDPDGRFVLGRLERSISAARTEALRTEASAHQVTLNTLVQGAWANALSRLADTDDVTFGVVTSGRPAELEGVEDTVGMFLAALPFRTQPFQTQPFQTQPTLNRTAWLRELQTQQLDLITHQHLGLSEVQRLAALPAGSELFDSVLVFENFPQTPEPTPDDQLTVERKSVFEQTHYGLTVMVRPEECLHFSVLYDRSRFSEADVEAMVDLLLLALEHPEQELTADDEALLAAVNDTAAPFDNDTTLHDLLLEVAKKHPDQAALIEHRSGQTCTFGSLDQRAAAMAGHLIDQGVGPGQAVGVALPRTIDLVVTLLAVWKAGAAYAPLDPSLDRSRLADLIDRADIQVIVHDGGIDTPDGVTVVSPNSSGPSRHVTVDAMNAACVSFTSGSTGEPKPVELNHRGIVNRCQWQLDAYPLAADETCVSKTTLNFVDHLWELWGPLLGGAPVVLVEDEVVKDPRAFVACLEDHGIRRLTMVPSLLDALLDSFHGHQTALDTITLSGETLPTRLVKRVRDTLPGVELLNFYGMSEGTADATHYRLTGDSPEPDGPTVPIGRPIANTTVEVLDHHGRPSPVGVEGEIYIGGVALANGYRGQPTATAERFIAATDGQRLYRSGDRGRWRRDGTLEFLGRGDSQVKIRGIRIELSAVEADLQQHPAIAAAVVSVTGSALRRTLAAHVLLSETDRPTLSELQAWARAHLPAATVPNTFHFLDELPVLPSGKVDRAAVARSADAAPRERRPIAHEALSDEALALIALWQDVLDVEQPVSLDDDFFEIGGDSLRAVRLFSRIDRTYGRDLPLAELFEATTPRAMLALLHRPEPTTNTVDPLVVLTGHPERFDALRRRLDGLTSLEVKHPDQGAAGGFTSPVHLAAHGTEARQALAVCVELQSAGTEVATLLLIDGAVTATDLTASGASPARIVFFEPSETDDRVPIIDDPTISARLDDRSRWQLDGSTDRIETVLIPGTPETALDEPNVSWLSHLISEQLEPVGSAKHLVPIGTATGPTRRLYAVHGEFGNVLGYRDLAVALGDDWSVIGVQASGVHGVQPLHRSIEEMATAYVTEILEQQPAGPYLIAGYSSGGTVAYEMGRLLRAAGHQVEPILWFDHYRVESAGETDSRSRQLVRLATSRLKAVASGRDALQAGLKRRDLQRKANAMTVDQEWWWAITEVAADRAEAENLRSMLIGNNMREVRSRYQHDNLEGPIVLYQAEQVDAGRDVDRGWADDQMDLERVPVPGTHTTLLLSPNVEAIAADLRRRFSAVEIVE